MKRMMANRKMERKKGCIEMILPDVQIVFYQSISL